MSNLNRLSKAWAFKHTNFEGREHFLGKYCWNHSRECDFPIMLFPTRRMARQAKKDCCFKKNVKIVRVSIFISEI